MIKIDEVEVLHKQAVNLIESVNLNVGVGILLNNLQKKEKVMESMSATNTNKSSNF